MFSVVRLYESALDVASYTGDGGKDYRQIVGRARSRSNVSMMPDGFFRNIKAFKQCFNDTARYFRVFPMFFYGVLGSLCRAFGKRAQ